jgi:hypothetical protein
VERTLDPVVLASALGEVQPGGVLPGPEELLRAITALEIAAFRTEHEMPEKVLATAWLLHGLAAADETVPGYDRAAVRNALAVSAHVMDLALRDNRRPAAERLQIAFAAQVGYRRCEQDPNATAVFRHVADLVHAEEPGIEDHIGTLAVEAGVAFLGLDRRSLVRALRAWRRQFRGLRELMGLPSMAGTMYGPAEAVVEAVYHLHTHLAFGDSIDLDVARTALRSVVEGRAGQGDRLARWVAAHLLELSGELTASSLYTLLPPGTPSSVARTFALSEPPVLTLWPPQRQLLRREHGNPIDPATSHSLICVPTSAGKTLMAQLVICSHLAQGQGRVLYVSPMRSLGREMRAALRSRLRLLGHRLVAEQPDLPATGGGFARSTRPVGDVEVLTPERLMHMIRTEPDTSLDGVGLIVVDEAHHLAQNRRGFVLESLLAILAARAADGTGVRLVLLSAAVGNRAQLATWLDPSRPAEEVYFTDTWRGPRRLHGLLYPHLLKDRANIAPRRPSRLRPETTKATVPVVMRLAVRPTADHAVQHLVTKQLGTRTFAGSNPARWTTRTKLTPWLSSYEVVAAGAAALVEAGSVLVVADTKRAARDTARAIARHLPRRPQTAALTEFLTDTLGAEHPLVACTHNGVAYHHGDLPDDVLRAIEDALRAGHLVAVACTSTLTEGVNLPVRTVIVQAPVGDDRPLYDGQRRLLPAELLNAVGRAGRAGRESEGWILLARHGQPSPDDFAMLAPDTEQLTVKSALLTEEALADLASTEDTLRQDADALFALADSITADFASFVWLVLHTQATNQAPLQRSQPTDAVKRLLAMEQAPDPEISARWLTLAGHVAQVYNRTDRATAGRWSSTGTSLLSARFLDRLAQRLTGVLAAQSSIQESLSSDAALLFLDNQEWPLGRTLDFLTEHGVFEELLTLPEVSGAWRFTDRERRGTAVDVPIDVAVRGWMSGKSIPELARTWMPELPAEWALEQAVRNISGTFEHALSWTLGALVNLVDTLARSIPGAPVLNGHTAWFLRQGVDTDQALTLLVSGIASRRLAHLAGRDAVASGITGQALRPWLAQQHMPGWMSRYQAKTYEIDDLLEYVRSPSDLASRFFAGAAISIPIHRFQPGRTDGPVVLEHPGSDRPVAVHREGHLIGTVPADHHLNILAILDSGLDGETHLSNGQLIIGPGRLWRR